MKKIFIAFIALLALVGCGTGNQVIGTDGKPLSKEESQKVIRNPIASKVENRSYRILVDKMTPMHGPMMHLRDNDWALEIHHDSIGSILPYIGRGYNVPYGSAMGFHFITRIDSYTQEKPKPDMWRINIKCHNNMEGYNFQIEIYDNGQAYISVVTRYRDIISYSGNIDVNGIELKKASQPKKPEKLNRI